MDHYERASLNATFKVLNLNIESTKKEPAIQAVKILDRETIEKLKEETKVQAFPKPSIEFDKFPKKLIQAADKQEVRYQIAKTSKGTLRVHVAGGFKKLKKAFRGYLKLKSGIFTPKES